MKRPEPQPIMALEQVARRLENEIAVERACASRGGAFARERKLLARNQGEGVADAGEGDEAFEFVVAVGPPSEDVQAEVDLGRSTGGERRVTQERSYPPFFLSSARSESADAGLS